MTNQDGQLIKDITATLQGDQPQHSPPGASPKTRHPGSKNLSSTRPALEVLHFYLKQEGVTGSTKT